MANTTQKITKFMDLDLNFIPNPITGDIVKSYDADSINKNLQYLILTTVYESPFHPEKSCQVSSLMFEPMDYITAQIIQRTIETVIQNFEPRVQALDIIVNLDLPNNAFTVTIYYNIINSNQTVTFTTTLERLR